jgi:hypothetical protein
MLSNLRIDDIIPETTDGRKLPLRWVIRFDKEQARILAAPKLRSRVKIT